MRARQVVFILGIILTFIQFTSISAIRASDDFKEPSSTKSAGIFDPNCSANTLYDACLFWKNPVAHRGSVLPDRETFFSDIASARKFGVKLKNQIQPEILASPSIRVYGGPGVPEAAPQQRHWRRNLYTAQLTAYFWLTLQEEEMLKRSGIFFSRGKNISVLSSVEDQRDFASFDGRTIRMGYTDMVGVPRHEIGISAEVYMHEMGHANLFHAVGDHLYPAPGTQGSISYRSVCLSERGCIGAINEGQADFHAQMIFYDSPAMGQTWVNNMNGFQNVAQMPQLTAGQAFQNANPQGEVHQLGHLYSSILWTIYNSSEVNKIEFEKVFSQHLMMLTGSADFKFARDRLLDSDKLIFPPNGKHQSIITNAFAQRGIAGP